MRRLRLSFGRGERRYIGNILAYGLRTRTDTRYTAGIVNLLGGMASAELDYRVRVWEVFGLPHSAIVAKAIPLAVRGREVRHGLSELQVRNPGRRHVLR